MTALPVRDWRGEPRLLAAMLDGERVTLALVGGHIWSVGFTELGVPVDPPIVLVEPDEEGVGLYLLREDGTVEDCSLALLLAPGTSDGGQELGARVAARVRELRAQRGWSQRETARRLGVAASNYARLERGKHVPATQTLVKLAACFEVPLVDLVVR